MDIKIDKDTMQLGAVISGIGAIMVIECVALYNGIDGAMLAAAFAAVGAAIGYIFKARNK